MRYQLKSLALAQISTYQVIFPLAMTPNHTGLKFESFQRTTKATRPSTEATEPPPPVATAAGEFELGLGLGLWLGLDR